MAQRALKMEHTRFRNGFFFKVDCTKIKVQNFRNVRKHIFLKFLMNEKSKICYLFFIHDYPKFVIYFSFMIMKNKRHFVFAHVLVSSIFNFFKKHISIRQQRCLNIFSTEKHTIKKFNKNQKHTQADRAMCVAIAENLNSMNNHISIYANPGL